MVRKKKIEELWTVARDLCYDEPEIDVLPNPPTASTFLRDYGSMSRPCKILNAMVQWPSVRIFSHAQTLSSVLGTRNVTVSLFRTPDGRDGMLTYLRPRSRENPCFAFSHIEVGVSFSEALAAVLSSSRGRGVARLEGEARHPYAPWGCNSGFSWASEAFGGYPISSFCIANDLSVSPFQQEPDEAIYAVISGKLHFTLIPHTEVHRVYIRSYPVAQYSYHQVKQTFELKMLEPGSEYEMCTANLEPTIENFVEYPLYFRDPEPFTCTVKAGEILYVPSLWFRHIKHIPGDGGYTAAVKYRYDVDLDTKFAYYQLLKSEPCESSSSSSSSETTVFSDSKEETE